MAEIAVLIICWLLAAIFAVAIRHKVSAWPRFKAAFIAYRIVPERFAGFVAGSLTIAEITALIALLSLQAEGLVLATGLLVVYVIAIAVNLRRGRTQIDCGCGDEPTPLSLVLVLRNMGLIGLALYALVVPPAAGDVTWGATLVAAGAVLIAFGLYSAIDQLIANRGRHQRLWLREL